MTIGMTRGYVEHAFSLHRHHLMMTMMMTLMTLFRILYVSSQTPAVPTKALDRLSSEKARSEDKSWTREAAGSLKLILASVLEDISWYLVKISFEKHKVWDYRGREGGKLYILPPSTVYWTFRQLDRSIASHD